MSDKPRRAGRRKQESLVARAREAVGLTDEDSPEKADPAAIPDQSTFRIGEVSELVGVDTHVLRYWESEFRMKPRRSASGQRLYQKKDLSQFLRIKHLLHEEGYTIAGARKVLAGGGEARAAAVDDKVLRDALARIQALRRRIRAYQDELA